MTNAVVTFSLNGIPMWGSGDYSAQSDGNNQPGYLDFNNTLFNIQDSGGDTFNPSTSVLGVSAGLSLGYSYAYQLAMTSHLHWDFGSINLGYSIDTGNSTQLNSGINADAQLDTTGWAQNSASLSTSGLDFTNLSYNLALTYGASFLAGPVSLTLGGAPLASVGPFSIVNIPTVTNNLIDFHLSDHLSNDLTLMYPNTLLGAQIHIPVDPLQTSETNGAKAHGLTLLHTSGETGSIADLSLDMNNLLALVTGQPLLMDSLNLITDPGGGALSIQADIIGVTTTLQARIAQSFSFTPDKVDVTLFDPTQADDQGNAVQIGHGKLGDKFNIDTPEGEGTMTVDAVFDLTGDLRNVTKLILEGGINIDFLKAEIKNTILAPGLGFDFQWGPVATAHLSLGSIDLTLIDHIYHLDLGQQTVHYTFNYEKFYVGTEGDDSVTLTTHQVTYNALGGDDHVYGNGLANTIDGGAGSDLVGGGEGDDTITDLSNDFNQLYGEDGNDTITAGAGDDLIYGDRIPGVIYDHDPHDGNDTINAGDGSNTVLGGGGNDQITTGTGNDAVDGGDGNDTINAGAGKNTVYGGAGDDHINAGSGDDTIYGDNSPSFQDPAGPDGNDIIDAGNGTNKVYGRGGNDTIIAGSGVDTIDGGDGFDTVSYEHSTAGIQINLTDGVAAVGGYADGDIITNVEAFIGSNSSDVMIAGTSAENFQGLGGADILGGNIGNDTLAGGAGADRLAGGGGSDTFVFDNSAIADAQGSTPVIDEIIDFNRGNSPASSLDANEGDTIDVSGILGVRYTGGTTGEAAKGLTRIVANNDGLSSKLQINIGTEGHKDWLTIAKLDGVTGGEHINVKLNAAQPAVAMTVLTEQVFFLTDAAGDGNSLVSGNQLWYAQPPGINHRYMTVSSLSSPDPSEIVQANGKFFFAQNDGVHGRELWVSDGTIAGTKLVTDLNISGDANPQDFYVYDDKLVFVASDGVTGYQVYSTDGESVTQLTNIHPNVSSYNNGYGTIDLPAGIQIYSGTQPHFTTINGQLYFDAVNGSDILFNGPTNQLYKSDGTAAGTGLALPPEWNGAIEDRGYNPVVVVRGNSELAFSYAFQGNGYNTPMGFDASLSGTYPDIKAVVLTTSFDFASWSNPVLIGSKIFFTGPQGLWVSIAHSIDAIPGAPIIRMYADNDLTLDAPKGEVFVTGNDLTLGNELFVSDGTAAGSHIIDINLGSGSSNPNHLTVTSDGTLYFSADKGDGTGVALWKYTDGGGAQQLKTFVSSYDSVKGFGDNNLFFVVHNKIYFQASDGTHGNQLWVSDGTAAGTVKLTDLYDTTGLTNINDGATFMDIQTDGDSVFFRANVGGTYLGGGPTQIFQTDGTLAGTHAITTHGDSGTFTVFMSEHPLVFNNTAPTGMDHVASLGDSFEVRPDNTYTLWHTHQFSVGDFGFHDADGNDMAGVKITSIQSGGQLILATNPSSSLLVGAVVNAGDTISIADIKAHKLVYKTTVSPDHTFTFQVKDDGGTENGAGDTDLTARTMTMHVDQAPAISGLSTSVTYDTVHPVKVAGAAILSDTDDTNLLRLSVYISSGKTGDALAVDQSVLNQTNIIVLSNNSSGLSLYGTDTIANYQAVLRSMTFSSTSTLTGDRTLSYVAQDPAGVQNFYTSATLHYNAGTGNLAITTSPASGTLISGQTLTITVDASAALSGQSLTVTGKPTLTLNSGGVASYDAAHSDLAHGKVAFSYVVKAGEVTPAGTDLFITAVNSSSSNAIKVGTAILDTSAAVSADLGVKVDAKGPSLSFDLVSPSSGHSVHIGDHVLIGIKADEAATVTGAPVLALSNGGKANFLHMSGRDLVFDYVVASGQDTADLKAGTITLPTGATIKDGLGNAANLGSFTGADLGLVIDTKAPTISKIAAVPATGTLKPGDALTINVTMSEAVSVSGTPKFALSDGGFAIYDDAHSTSTILAFKYTVASGEAASALTLTPSSLTGGAIVDVGGNALTLASKATTLGVKVDGVAPAVTAISASPALVNGPGAKLVISLSLSEAATLSGGAPTLTLSNGGIAVFDAVKSTATSLKFNYTVNSADANASNLSVTAYNANGSVVKDALNNSTSTPSGLSTAPIGVQVHTSSADNWTKQSGLFNLPSNWSTGFTPDLTKDAVMEASGTYTVTSGFNQFVASFSTSKTTTFAITGGIFTATGGTGLKDNAGGVTIAAGETLRVGDVLSNKGTVKLFGTSGGDATVEVINGLQLKGAGKLVLSDADQSKISGSGILTNADNEISGAGTVGAGNTLNLVNQAKGTIIANSATHALVLQSATAIQNAGKLVGAGAAGLDIRSTVANSGTITTSGPAGHVIIEKMITNSATGVVSTGATGNTIDLINAAITGGKVSTVAGSALNVLSGASAISGTTVNNAGTVQAHGGNLTITGSVTNTGTLIADGSTLDITGAISAGSAKILSNGILEFGSSAAKIAFDAAAHGTIVADTAAGFKGSVAGFSVGDTFDFTDINFATAAVSYTGNATSGTLKVTDGTHTANVALTGDYAVVDGVGFAKADDGHGHTLITVTGKASAGADAVVKATVGADTLDGANTKTVSYQNSASGVTVDLGSTAAQGGNGDGRGDVLTHFPNIIGSAFADSLKGDANANVITGGVGADVLTGLAGADHFHFNGIADAVDTITDFGVPDGDLIEISKAGFKIAANLSSSDFAGHYLVAGAAPGATEKGHGQFLFDSATGHLFWDADGSGSGKAVLLTTLINEPQGFVLHASDFILVA